MGTITRRGRCTSCGARRAAKNVLRGIRQVVIFPITAVRWVFRIVAAPVRLINEARARRSESRAQKAARLAAERFARMAPWEQDEVNRTRRRLSR